MRTIGVLPKSITDTGIPRYDFAGACSAIAYVFYAARAVQYAAGWRIDSFPRRRVDHSPPPVRR